MQNLCFTYRKRAANDEEGEGSGRFIHMCFSYKAAYVFQVDAGQIKLIRSLLTGSKRNFWAVSSEATIRQVIALHWKNTNHVDISRWMMGCGCVFSAGMGIWQRRLLDRHDYFVSRNEILVLFKQGWKIHHFWDNSLNDCSPLFWNEVSGTIIQASFPFFSDDQKESITLELKAMQVRSNVVLQAVSPTKYRAVFLWEAAPQTNWATHPNTLHFPTCLPCLCSCPSPNSPSLSSETLPPPKPQLKFHILREISSFAKGNTFLPLAPRVLRLFLSTTLGTHFYPLCCIFHPLLHLKQPGVRSCLTYPL